MPRSLGFCGLAVAPGRLSVVLDVTVLGAHVEG